MCNYNLLTEKKPLKILVFLCAAMFVLSFSEASAAVCFKTDIRMTETENLKISLADFHGLLSEGFDTEGKCTQTVYFTIEKTEKNSEAEDSYIWRQNTEDGQIFLTLKAQNANGAAYGLYGLLQERLGYSFYHPRKTIFPNHASWPLNEDFRWEASPRFENRGFHLHTMHPIELTEQLHDPDFEGGLSDVKEYVDWLVRNGQNTMQFWLLRTVDKLRWPEYASRYIEYARMRGVRTGVQISLSTLQQKAFQLLNVLDVFTPYEAQIDESLGWLFQVPFDYAVVDFTMGEYLPDLTKLFPSLKEYTINAVQDDYGVRAYEATHVIKRKDSDKSSYGSGILIHTVMFYSLTEENAPVYGNINQKFMLERAHEEALDREVWYWPESSYWVTFDTSVPLLLLPYLTVRYEDMMTMEKLGAKGHVTFTSGWEWGYWSIDWSLARWSFRHVINGREETQHALSALQSMFADEKTDAALKEALRLQNLYMKEKKLVGLLSAKPPFAEFPWPFNKSFQPASGFSETLVQLPMLGESHRVRAERSASMLTEFYIKASANAENLAHALDSRAVQCRGLEILNVAGELADAIYVTALRARHKSLTIRALLHRGGMFKKRSDSRYYSLLNSASNVRMLAQDKVRSRENFYRYPVGLLARRYSGHTSYAFGYLYPVAGLHFWAREEEQVSRGRFDAFFMNIWDFTDTLGLDGLF